jgi:RNA polymerase sigma-70 factor, ECF subfamily
MLGVAERETLPVAQRSAILRHYVEEFSLEEIARITGTNAGTVKSQLHYAKRALRKLLEKEQLKHHAKFC